MVFGGSAITKNWKNGVSTYKIITLLMVMLKLISTFASFSSSLLHEVLGPFSSYSVPFLFAIMYDDMIAERWGIMLLLLMVVVFIAWFLFPIMMLIKNKAISLLGTIGIIALNILDIITCVQSYAQLQSAMKAINLAFSGLLVMVSCLLLWKKAQR